MWVFPLDPVARRLGSGKPLTEDGARAECLRALTGRSTRRVHLLRPGIGRRELWITNIVDGTSNSWSPTVQVPIPSWSPRRKGDCLYLLFDWTSSRSPAGRPSGSWGARSASSAGGAQTCSWTSTGAPSEASSVPIVDTPDRKHVIGSLADDESRRRQTGPGADLQAEDGFLAGAGLTQWPMAELCCAQE